MTSRTRPADGLPDARVIDDGDLRRRVLVATCLALMAVVASASGLSVAQQPIALDLDASQSGVLWIINAYVVALAALLLPMGAVADRWGRKPVLVTGLIAFMASTVAAGLVSSVEAMVVVRVGAGLSAAMIMPVTLSVITSSFPADTRTQAIGVWSGVAGGGGMLGMLAAALLTDVASWRWLFALPVAFAAAALVLTVRSVPNSREARGGRFDVVGALLSVLGIGALVLGIHEGPELGWSDPLTLAGLTGGVAALVAFVWREFVHDDPLLDVRVFADRRLASGSTALLLVFAISAGVFVVLFPFFQAVLGWSALHSMLGLLPMLVVLMGASGAAARISNRFGQRATMITGVGAVGVGLAAMATLVSADGGYLPILPGLMLVGLGMGLAMPPATEAITSSLPDDRQGIASALNDTTRELGSAFGIALLGAVLNSMYSASIKDDVAGLPDDIARAAQEGIGRAFDVAAGQPNHAQAAALMQAARDAFVDGWAGSMWVGAGIMAALVIFLSLRSPLRRPRPLAGTGISSDSRPDPAATGAPERLPEKIQS